MEGYACGLDLGTTFSCIGVFKNGGVEIIPNRNGDKITPSIVTIIDEKNILKGEETMEYLVKNYDSSIYAIKRFIGRDFNDKRVKDEIDYEKFPFIITGNSETNHIVVEINKNGKILEYNLEEISSFVIRKMVDNAEEYLKSKINKLVITVPANFNDSQRKCTKQAAELAGIEVLRIINEPTAAALAYGLQENENNNGNILVFDLGGGTFDVTILKIIKNNDTNSEKLFEILSTSGDKFLGGEDFDNKLAEFALNDFRENNEESIEQIRKDKKAIKRLKIACENIKKVLSYNEQATLCINHFYNNKDIDRIVTKKDFETLCDDLFEKIMKPLDDALIDKKITEQEIKQIILVGGSTRIPKIKEMLKKNSLILILMIQIQKNFLRFYQLVGINF
jgi:L1 cell adhesion molecule like protein